MKNLSTFEESVAFVAREYPRAHLPECGKPMSRRQLSLLTNQLKKAKYSDEEVLKWMLYFDTLEKPVTQRAACKWMCDAAIILPEDEYKVMQAVKVAKLNHVDPLQYPDPMSLINAFAPVRMSHAPIDPATVSTLRFRYHNPEWDIDVYEVEESWESRKNLRKIINTHLGIQCNPWCLLVAEKDGELSYWSSRWWRKYRGLKKKVAFQHGRLYAFSAGSKRPRIWYDRMDRPHKGEEVRVLPVENDPLKRCATFRVDTFTGEKELLGDIHRGNPMNGLYERYRSLRNKKPYYSEFFWKGRPLGGGWHSLSEEQKRDLYDNSDFEKGIIRIPESFERVPHGFLCFAKALTEVYIPDRVEVLDEGTFEGCSNLEKVRLPAHITRIPAGLFKGCTSLRHIILSESIEEIGDYAFANCMALQKLHLPRKLTSIGNGVFLNCKSLPEVKIPSRVTTIGNGAFGGCAFTEVTIPDSVQSIAAGAFSLCMNIRTFHVCKRWYGMFHERYGRRVRLLPNTETSTEHKCAS